MTTVNFVTVARSIAQIDLRSRGIYTANTDNVPVNAISVCPAWIPKAADFISTLNASRKSFGAQGTEKMDIEYDMTWQYFHAPVGQVLTLQEFTSLLDNLAYIIEQMSDNDQPTNSVDMKFAGIKTIGIVADAANNQYFGAEVILRITEFING